MKAQDGSGFVISHSLAAGGTQCAAAESLDETIDNAMYTKVAGLHWRNQ